MLRVLLVAALTSIAVAAPVPPETEAGRMSRIFGTHAGTTEGHRFELDREKLKITVPEAKRRRGGGRLDEAACVWREWEGDFNLTVRLSSETPKPGGVMHHVMGLVAWSNEETHLMLGREFWRAELNRINDQFDVEYFYPCGRRTARDPDRTDPKPEAYLRLVRVGNQITAGHSRDGGKSWNEFFPDHVDMKAKNKVGVFARNIEGGPFIASFDQYSLTQPKKKP